jgi:hypothetical protein
LQGIVGVVGQGYLERVPVWRSAVPGGALHRIAFELFEQAFVRRLPPIKTQSGFSFKAARAAVALHSTGFNFEATWIQPGIRAVATKTDERKFYGQRTKFTTSLTDSVDRRTNPREHDSGANGAEGRAALCLHFAYYNLCRMRRSLPITPAMESETAGPMQRSAS